MVMYATFNQRGDCQGVAPVPPGYSVPDETRADSIWLTPDKKVALREPAPFTLPDRISRGESINISALPDTRLAMNGLEIPFGPVLGNVAMGTYSISLRGRYRGDFLVLVMDRKSDMLAAVKATRDRLTFGLAPTTPFGPVDINDKGRSNLHLLSHSWNGVLQPLLHTIKFKNGNDEHKMLTQAQFLNMMKQIADFIIAVQANKDRLDALIKAPNADLSKIDINSGWPTPGVRTAA